MRIKKTIEIGKYFNGAEGKTVIVSDIFSDLFWIL